MGELVIKHEFTIKSEVETEPPSFNLQTPPGWSNQKPSAENLSVRVKTIQQRAKNLDDFKQSLIKKHDQMRDELYVSFCQMTYFIRTRLDEMIQSMSGRILDEILSVDVLRLRINEKLELIGRQLNESDSVEQEKLDFFESQLTWAAEKLSSIASASCNQHQVIVKSESGGDLEKSLNIDLFHPKAGLEQLITHIISDKSSSQVVSTDVMTRLKKGVILDVIVSSGVNDNGEFYVQVGGESNQLEPADEIYKLKQIYYETNRYIDDLNRQILAKILSDESWRNFAEMNLTPAIGEICFCLEQRSSRWMRAVIRRCDEVSATCQVDFVDSGNYDVVCLEHILPWREGLLEACSRTIKCVLMDTNGTVINEIDKSLFLEKTDKVVFKCLLVNDENASYGSNTIWSVKLIRFSDYIELVKAITTNESAESVFNILLENQSGVSLNEKLSKKTKVNKPEKPISTISIKKESVENSSSKITFYSPPIFQSKISSSQILEDINDQTDFNRLYSDRKGLCRANRMDQDGFIWISPRLDQKQDDLVKWTMDKIGEYLSKPQVLSFGEMGIVPISHQKCYVRELHFEFEGNKRILKPTWHRGFIEHVSIRNEICFVRDLDTGKPISPKFNHVFRHLELNQFEPPIPHLKHLAIRCCMTRNAPQLYASNFKYSKSQRLEMNYETFYEFELVEQLNFPTCHFKKAWLAVLKKQGIVINIDPLIGQISEDKKRNDNFSTKDSYDFNSNSSERHEKRPRPSKRLIDQVTAWIGKKDSTHEPAVKKEKI